MGYTVTDEIWQNRPVSGKPVEVRIRATNVFRKERGGWKMIHHQTDMFAPDVVASAAAESTTGAK